MEAMDHIPASPRRQNADRERSLQASRARALDGGPRIASAGPCAIAHKSRFTSLRIGLKRFRYIVENFLPEQHAAWSDDLKELQDLLGEVHDLDVLWATALQVNAFPDAESRSKWHSRIIEERTQQDREIPWQDAGQGFTVAGLAQPIASRESRSNRPR